ncbi:MAG: L,D-transpeptidase family protein [Desulfuromonadales bacterium]|nr:L,D-transpeptidase family protein [Desulfuromonadales bacterium]
MKLRHTLTSCLIVLLLSTTVVSVSALWNQKPPVESVPSVLFSPFDNQTEQQWLLSLTEQQEALWDRLKLRLQLNPDDYEASLLKALLFFQTAQLDAALEELDGLTRRAPKFQLAHLILGDLLLARFDQLEQIGSTPLLATINSDEERIEQLRSEASVRLQGYLSLIDKRKIPRALISLSDSVKHVLVVDKSKNRLYIYENAGTAIPPTLIDDYYIVLGKKTGNKVTEGDLRTPSGVYFVTHFIADEDLPRKYGTGAFPVNYPNEYDRFQRKTGDGIWLHGTDKELYSRPPLDSEGCVVLTNEEFSRIRQYVKPGETPVIISEQVEWIPAEQWLARTIELQTKLESWRQNWENADIPAYLDDYSINFWAQGHDYKSWSRYKKSVLSRKKFQKIDLSDISLFGYPRQSVNGKEVVVANFRQRYRSNNYNGDINKRLYLIHENGDWRVLYEGRR